MAKSSRDKLVYYAINTIIGFILLSSALSFWNRYVTYDTRSIIEKTERTKLLTEAIDKQIVNQIDQSVNGYANSENENRLASFNLAIAAKDSILALLETSLKELNYDVAKLNLIRLYLNDYIKEAKSIIEAIRTGDKSKVIENLKNFQFKGDPTYRDFVADVFKFENEIEDHAKSDYEWSITDNAIIQIILIVLSIPILIIASRKLTREIQNNQRLIRDLDDNNRKYLFNDGSVIETSAQLVVEKSISSFKLTFDFVNNVANGKYSQAEGLVSQNVRPLNQNTLMGALLQMNQKLRANEEEDQKRQWTSTGLNQFSEIVRNNQHDLNGLTEKSVAFLTKYLKSQQGSLFKLVGNDDNKYLELEACYAFDRKKWIQKRIDIGVGLVGQTYLEREPAMLTQIPNGYTSITSGLGDATPTCLLIVPFLYNENVEAILEVAGFTRYETYQVDFLKKAGEFLASALQTAKNNNGMKDLLQKSQEQAEILKAQEEELRQNVEELEATQEALRRE